MSQGNTRQRPSSPPAPPPAGRGRPGIATLVVLFLAFFALALAVLLRVFVADRMLVAPANTYSTAELQAVNASYLDRATGQTRDGATLTLTSTIRGDVEAAQDDIVVWDAFVVMEDLQNDTKLEISEYRLAFDRRSGELVNCCGAAKVPESGEPAYAMFFPIDIEKKTYNVFDPSTGKVWPMRYQATENRNGREVYRFVQEIPETDLGPMDQEVPASLLGLPGDGGVPANRYYRATSTMWIDAGSGVMVDRRQQVVSTVKSRDGRGQVVAAEMDLRMSQEARDDLADQAATASTAALLLRTLGPAIGLGAGILLLAVGILLLVRDRRSKELTREPFSAS